MLVFIVSLRTVKSVSRVFHVTGGQFISCDYFVWKFGFILNVTTSSFFGEIVCSIWKQNFLIDETNLGKAAGRYFGVKHVVLYLAHIWGIPPKCSMAPIWYFESLKIAAQAAHSVDVDLLVEDWNPDTMDEKLQIVARKTFTS